VPLAFWLVIEHRMAWAFCLFILAGLSDALDGWLARRYGGNAVGAMLDPLADKALGLTMFITLAAVGALPDWLAIMVVFRDVLIVGGIMILSVLGQAVPIRPLYISKVNTVVQIVVIGFTLFQAGFGIHLPGMQIALIWLVAVTTLVSGSAYVWQTARGEAGGASGSG
jgi:cardiolipin synthase